MNEIIKFIYLATSNYLLPSRKLTPKFLESSILMFEGKFLDPRAMYLDAPGY